MGIDNRIMEKINQVVQLSSKKPTHILMTTSTLKIAKEAFMIPINHRLNSMHGLKVIIIQDDDLQACSPRVRQSLEEEGILLLRLPEGF